jgi:penicillin-binding protein 2
MFESQPIRSDAERVDYKRHGRWAVLAIAVLLLALLYRFFSLQVMDGEKYQGLAEINHVGSERIPARRGLLKDRRGRVLARNVDGHQVLVTPHYLKDPARVLPWLRDTLELTNEEYLSVLDRVRRGRTKARRFNPVVVSRNVVATHCPYDQSELELVDPVSHYWCRLDGAHLVEPDDERCALAHMSEGTTNLECPVCNRRFNNQHAIVSSWLHALPGVTLRSKMRRQYLGGESAPHVVGYMNEVNPRDLEKWPDAYVPGDFIGRSGVERSMEPEIRGLTGRRYFLRDSRGIRTDPDKHPELKEQLKSVPAIAGQNVWLAIDLELQRVIKSAFRYQHSGAAVVMDPHTGEILGLYSKPGFDSNVWSGRLTRSIKRTYDENPYAPMMNKAVTGYAPGSIYKVVTALAGLADGVVTPSTDIHCPGYYEFGGNRFDCHKRVGHGDGIALDFALTASCNVYFYRLGEALGMDRLAHHGSTEFLLGQRTGIDLFDQLGRVPTKDWYREFGRVGWQPGFTLQAAVGQGSLTATPLQMARLYSALVNGGYVYRPLLVLQLESEQGEVVRRYRPEVQHELPYAPEILASVRQGLEHVVSDSKEGTGHSAFLSMVNVGGKTGTAEAEMFAKGVSEEVAAWLQQSHAWFVGFAPAEAPQLVVVVFVEHGGGGGKIAAPIARQIIDQYFRRGLGEVPSRRRSAPSTSEGVR